MCFVITQESGDLNHFVDVRFSRVRAVAAALLAKRYLLQDVVRSQACEVAVFRFSLSIEVVAMRTSAQVISLASVLHDIRRRRMLVREPIRRSEKGLDLRDRECLAAGGKMEQDSIVRPGTTGPRTIVRFRGRRAGRRGRIGPRRGETVCPGDRISAFVLMIVGVYDFSGH